jgi:integrase
MEKRTHLNKDEIEQVLEYARKDSVRNWCALVIGFNHGCRVSELVGGRKQQRKSGVLIPAIAPLRVSDIDFKNRQITIRRLKGSRDTTQPLIDYRGKPALSDSAALKAYFAVRTDDGSGLLFVGQKGRMTRWTLNAIFREYCEAVSAERVVKGQPAIPEDAMHWHVLRHSVATMIASQPGATVFQVAAHLGHANVQNAQIYWHPDSRANGVHVQKALSSAFAGL